MPKQTPLKNEPFFLDDDDIELLESNGICEVPKILKDRLRMMKRRRTQAKRLEWNMKK
jgi:hypothetical protein